MADRALERRPPADLAGQAARALEADLAEAAALEGGAGALEVVVDQSGVEGAVGARVNETWTVVARARYAWDRSWAAAAGVRARWGRRKGGEG